MSLSRRVKMKAGCSIVEKPEGGGGEQKLIISDVPGRSLSGSCSLNLSSVHKCQTMTDSLLARWILAGRL